MNKITFVNEQEPAVNANNLNLMQTNAENAIADAKSEAISSASTDATTKVNAIASTLRTEISTAQSNAIGTAQTYTDNKVKNATLTIKRNGTNVATFSANASSNVSADISVPTVNNATLTIQKNGTTVASFGANASSNVNANITVPTNNNQLTNGAGYQTSANVNTLINNKIKYGTSLPSTADNGTIFLLYS